MVINQPGHDEEDIEAESIASISIKIEDDDKINIGINESATKLK